MGASRNEEQLLISRLRSGLIKVTEIPPDKLTEKICLTAVKEDAKAIRSIPEKFLTDEVCLAAVSKKGISIILSYVPEKKRTLKICLVAVTTNSDAIKYVPVELRTAEICQIAFNEDAELIEYIPEEHCTQEMCQIAVAKNVNTLQYIPKKYLTEDLYRLAFDNNVLAIEFFPAEMRTSAICHAAVEKNPFALQYVPVSLCTLELCLLAVSKDGTALHFVPTDFCTKEVCIAAVKNNPEALRDVPDKFQTSEMYLAAVKRNGAALRFVPENKRTKDICISAVSKYGQALEEVPLKLRTYELCLVAVDRAGEALEFVPKDMWTPEMCLVAVKQEGNMLRKLPDEKCTPEICLAAVMQNGMAITYVPQAMRNEEVYLAAVKQNIKAFNEVPYENRTREMYLEVVRKDSLKLADVPEDLKADIIKELTLEKILSNNYKAREYLPNDVDYSNQIKEFLSNVRHVVIAGEGDHETNDCFFVYDDKRETTVRINKSDIDELLPHLKDASINLVLLDHCNAKAKSMCELSAQEVVDVLEKYNHKIISLKALGCYSIQSLRLAEESTKIDEFKLNEAKVIHAALMLASVEPDPKDYNKFFMKLKKDESEPSRIYILCKQGNQYKLQCLQRLSDNTISVQNYHVDAEMLRQLEQAINKDKGKQTFPFPGKNVRLDYYRRSLNKNELTEISAALNSNAAARRAAQKKAKQDDPALMNIKISKEEAEQKLKPSFLHAILHLIKDKHHLQLESLKGFTRATHVDTSERKFLISETHLYPPDYRSEGFFERTKNIKRKKLKVELEGMHKDLMREEKSESTEKKDSIVRSIKVNLRQRK